MFSSRNLSIMAVRYAAWKSQVLALRMQCDQSQPEAKAEVGNREKPGAERIAILGLGPGDYRGACILRQVETMF
jgi:hypothetical protein